MKRILLALLAATALTLTLAGTAFAQDYDYGYDYSYVCEETRNRIFAGDPSLTPAELLSCGLSPEAIGARPSINGPYGVGAVNECSYLPQGSPESVACYEWLVASMGY